MFLGVNTTCEEREAKREDVLLFFFPLRKNVLYVRRWETEWLNVAFGTGGRSENGRGLQLPTVWVFKMNLDPVDFPSPPANWRASHFEILLFRIMSRSPPVGAFWRFFPALRRNNTRFQNFKPSTQC